jgi:hypothetical protein
MRALRIEVARLTAIWSDRYGMYMMYSLNEFSSYTLQAAPPMLASSGKPLRDYVKW